MPRLLVVHHTPSPACQAMLDAVLDGTRAEGIRGVDVVTAAALAAGPADVLRADAIILGSPANLGTMSGALKHFFDLSYYPCLNETRGLGYGLFLHGNNDTDRAASDVAKIATGLDWRLLQPVVVGLGEPDRAVLDACWELGAAAAATISD